MKAFTLGKIDRVKRFPNLNSYTREEPPRVRILLWSCTTMLGACFGDATINSNRELAPKLPFKYLTSKSPSQPSQSPNTPSMSRHKIVKNLDLDDELDDYDGGDDYDDSYGGAEGGGAGGVDGL